MGCCFSSDASGDAINDKIRSPAVIYAVPTIPAGKCIIGWKSQYTVSHLTKESIVKASNGSDVKHILTTSTDTSLYFAVIRGPVYNVRDVTPREYKHMYQFVGMVKFYASHEMDVIVARFEDDKIADIPQNILRIFM